MGLPSTAHLAGTVVEVKNIEGLCYLQVGVRDDPSTVTLVLEMKRDLLAPDSVGHQFLQSRGLMILENPIFGFVAVLPIGMAQISSMVFTVSDNGHPALGKGAEFSYFRFDGTDIVCIFEARANVAFTAELNKHYNVGHQIAVAHPCPDQPRATGHLM